VRVAQNPQAAWRALEGHAFIVPHGDTGVVELDEVGTFIWQLVETERTLDEMVERICAEFEVEADRARSDCVAFVEDLGRRGLLSIRKDAP
jgi:coenzyme PQQ synthesis protein D (PqqD)